jgi:hypothetical protein
MAAAASTVAALVAAGLGAAPAAAATHPKAARTAAAPKLAQEAHRTFWDCPGKTTGVLIVVNTLTLHPGQSLTITFIVRNEGTAACSYVAPYAGAAPGPVSTTLVAGPCGSVPFMVEGAHNRNVYPGVRPFNCPALGFAQLQPNATTEGAGSWTQVGTSGNKRVSAGRYTLVVDGHFDFPLQIDAH